MSIQISCQNFKLGGLSFYCCVVSVLYIFCIQILPQTHDLQYFLSACGFSLNFLKGDFEEQSFNFFYVAS